MPSNTFMRFINIYKKYLSEMSQANIFLVDITFIGVYVDKKIST
jgi:hypothetical protein